MSTDTPAAAPITAEREAFETWAKTYDTMERGWWLRLLPDGGYSCQRADDAWEAWQARAALSAPVAAQPAASGVDAQWVEETMEKALVWVMLRNASTQAWDAAREDLRNHLSTALGG